MGPSLAGARSRRAAALGGRPAFSVQVARTRQELEHLLRAQADAGYGARMAAGFCWPWSDPRQDGSLVPDVVIGDWSRPWNLRGERAVGGRAALLALGRPIQLGSGRSAASTRRRDSSTTGTARAVTHRAGHSRNRSSSRTRAGAIRTPASSASCASLDERPSAWHRHDEALVPQH